MNFHARYFEDGASKLVSFKSAQDRLTWIGEFYIDHMDNLTDNSIDFLFTGQVDKISEDLHHWEYSPAPATSVSEEHKARVDALLNRSRQSTFETDFNNHVCDNEDCEGSKRTKPTQECTRQNDRTHVCNDPGCEGYDGVSR